MKNQLVIHKSETSQNGIIYLDKLGALVLNTFLKMRHYYTSRYKVYSFKHPHYIVYNVLL